MLTDTTRTLIVQKVEADSRAEQCGIQPGDRLLTYHGQSLISPAMLLALEENTFGVESVKLQGERDGKPLGFAVKPGKLGVEVRPELPEDLRLEYERGHEALQAHEYAKAAQCFLQASDRANENPACAWLLTKAGEAWEKVPDWPQALEAYETAWEGLQSGEDSASRSMIATGLGRCHQSRSEWDEAVSWYERAEQTNEAAGRELWRAQSLNSMGTIAWHRGDLDSAQDHYLSALRIRERLVPDSMVVASSLNNVGNVLWRRGDLASVQDYHTRALVIREYLAPDSLDVAGSLNNLGLVAQDLGDLAAAQDYHARALRIQERLAPDSLDVARSLNNLSNVAGQRGDQAAVQICLTRALRILEYLAPDSVDVARCLNNLGIANRQQGDLQAARDYHTRALRIFEHLAPESLDTPFSLTGLGNVALNLGDLDSAESYYSQALRMFERLAPASLDVANSLNNLGNVAYYRGDTESAQDQYVRALQIFERLAPESLNTAMSLNNLGNVARLRGDTESALNSLGRALEIFERLAPESLVVASNLNNLGTVARQSGDTASARNYFTRALGIYERLAPASLECAEALTELGQTSLQQECLSEALPCLQQAVRIVEQQRSAITSTEARALLLARHSARYAALIQGLLVLGQPEEAFSALERSRARSLLELLVERRLDFAAQAPPDLLQRQQELDRNRGQIYGRLAKLSSNERDRPEVESLHGMLHELERRQQELTDEIRAHSPHYASLQYPQPLDCKAAQRALDPGTLLLSYLVDEEQSFLFAITRKTVHTFTLALGRDTLAQRVQRFCRSLDVRFLEYDADDAIDQGRRLFAHLIGPAWMAVQRAKRLLICPDGPLHNLPFGALVTNPGGRPRYLAAYRPLHNSLSVTIYAQAREEAIRRRKESRREKISVQQAEKALGATDPTFPRQHTPWRLLAFGDPIYASSGNACTSARSRGSRQTSPTSVEEERFPTPNTQRLRKAEAPGTTRRPWQSPDAEPSLLQARGLSFASLPHSREEVRNLARLFGNEATVRLGLEATKTAALQESGEADILHFACHGWLDSKMPLSSGLALTQPEALGPAASEGDNGLLQAWEVFSKVKLKADLVVLSACRTGLGREVRGEGLVGLTRAFQYAGARSLVVSLWEVNDASTSVFMQAFYTALKAEKSKDEALRNAVQVLQSDAHWSDPYYWSAFVLIGDRL